MTDIAVILTLTLIAVMLILFFALRKKRKVLAKAAHFPYSDQYIRQSSPLYSPGAIVETNAGFSEGLLMSCAMNAGQCEAQPAANDIAVIDAATSFELPYVAQSLTGAHDPPAFTGFGGGDSAGGGATVDWGAPDTSSSYDSGSSDSYSGDSGSGGDS